MSLCVALPDNSRTGQLADNPSQSVGSPSIYETPNTWSLDAAYYFLTCPRLQSLRPSLTCYLTHPPSFDHYYVHRLFVKTFIKIPQGFNQGIIIFSVVKSKLSYILTWSVGELTGYSCTCHRQCNHLSLIVLSVTQ